MQQHQPWALLGVPAWLPALLLLCLESLGHVLGAGPLAAAGVGRAAVVDRPLLRLLAGGGWLLLCWDTTCLPAAGIHRC
jgi:hypothetical protein